MATLRHVLAPAAIFLSCSFASAQGPGRLGRYDLLQYHDSQGAVRQVTTPEEWQNRRAEVLRGMQEVMGRLPGDERRVPLEMKGEEETDAGSYLRRLITYQSEPESRTTAYLCIPKDVLAGKRKAPAVLCLHPTDNTVGHKVVVGLGGRAGRQYAAELAERGYVTLSPSYPHLADYYPNLERLGYLSGTMKAIWDNIRGLDLLASLPFVDAPRLRRDRPFPGRAQHDLHGRLRPPDYRAGQQLRLRFVSRLLRWKRTELVLRQGWCQIRYMPMMSNYRGRLEEIPFDFPELLGALAPRPLFVNAPLRDSNFRAESVDRCAAAATAIYKLLGGEGKLVVKHPDCEHDFPDEMRQEAYGLIDSALRD